jgi:hypothetical protein
MTRRDAVEILASLVREHGDSRDEIALGVLGCPAERPIVGLMRGSDDVVHVDDGSLCQREEASG